MKFNELIVSEELNKGIEKMGYSEPTPIQGKVIPVIKEGKDLIAKSNTGTGKTAAFSLPLLDKIIEGTYSKMLVVCPTRELVMQVENEVNNYLKYVNGIKSICVYGGTPINRQIKQLQGGFNVLIGTPGRILDLINRHVVNLKDADAIVLDEADEMLNMGFRDDIDNILGFTSKNRQSLMFSATMAKDIREFAKRFLSDPIEIEVKSKRLTVDKITQYYFDLVLEKTGKREVLELLLTMYKSDLTIVFCNTKKQVDELVDFLNRDGVNAVALHGDIEQNKRTKIMANFKKSKRMILVASDVAARGIDVNNIDLVVNYDLPQDNETYVHRIGRTGRAGKNGLAISLVKTRRDYRVLKGIMKYTKAEILPQELPSRDDINKRNKEVFKQKIKNVSLEGVCNANLQVANELIKEGLSAEEIISSLITIVNGEPFEKFKNIKPHEIKKPATIRINLGKDHGINMKNLTTAIKRLSSIDENKIGTISIKKRYTLIRVEKSISEELLKCLYKQKINGKRFEVTID